MNTLLLILGIVCLVVGLLGSVVPGLPGPPLSWVGMLLLSFTTAADFSTTQLIVYAAIAALITVLDYLIPSWGTKRFGGTKAGVWGCNIGLVISLFGLPFIPIALPAAVGIVVWPFLGAFVGELLNHQPHRKALRAAFGAFLGFLTGTAIKLAYSIVVAFVAIKTFI